MSTQHQHPQISPEPVTLSRRAVLLGGAGLLLGACSGGQSGTGPAPVLPDLEGGANVPFLQGTFSDGFLGASTIIAGTPQRATMILSAPDGLPIVNNLPPTLEVVLTGPDGTETPFSLPVRDAGVASPHYTLAWEPALVGEYLVSTTLEGDQLGFPFLVADRSELNLVQVGDRMRRGNTPTFDDAMGFDPICTRFDPCPFHDITLNQALDTPGPTVLMISTPGFCQTTSCGPVLDMLIAEHTNIADLSVVHAEVYTEPQKLADSTDRSSLTNPLLETYGMTFEPSMIVADDRGIVTARLDYNWDQTEAAEALATAVA